MRLAFLTATPLNIRQGSGTYAGVNALARALEAAGHEVRFFAPELRLSVFTAERLWFNEQLRRCDWSRFDAVVGVDMDGYRIERPSGCPHVASIKGVIADEMRFERGLTRFSMSLQAACEARHVHRADTVVTTSAYAASRIQELYGLSRVPSVVPEPINLEVWQDLFAANPAAPKPDRFTVLSVCRFYPRKRLSLLLEAAAILKPNIAELQIRIVGNGPERRRLLSVWRNRHLEQLVQWIGDVSQDDLAREYNRCDVFCLPSVQEGFGIVFLEAMAAGKPIVAAKASAVPEVVPHGVLVEPESSESLAEGLLKLYRDPALRTSIGLAGRAAVSLYGAPNVAREFLSACVGAT